MDLAPGASVGGYTLVRELGSGGMGAVWLARHPNLPRDVALKVMHPGLARTPGLRARFEREAEMVCRMSHPNVVDVLDRGQDGDRLWMSMPFVQGEDLAARIAREGALPQDDVVRIAAAVGDALDHAHARGLLHRDVKPANILLAPQPDGSERVYLTDFGIARAMEAGEALTRQGEVLATFAYASPEQVAGGRLDERADVYSFGAVLFEMLTGRRVFDTEDVLSLMWAVVNRPAPDVRGLRPDLPAPVTQVLARALAKEPAERFGSCRELVAALRSALTSRPAAPPTSVGAGPPVPHVPLPPPPVFTPAPPPSPAPGSRSCVWVLVAGAAVVVVGVVLAVALAGGGNGDGDGTAGGTTAPTAATASSAVGTISPAEVATGAEDALEEAIGRRPDITCPDPLPAEVGATTRCSLTDPETGSVYGVSVTVTSVAGTQARFDVQVDDQPQG
ncbi:protein kinase [Blastococcus sp. SYSU D00669]